MAGLRQKGFHFFVLPPMVFLFLIQAACIFLGSLFPRLPLLSDHPVWFAFPFLLVLFLAFYSCFRAAFSHKFVFALLIIFIGFLGYSDMVRLEAPRTGKFHVSKFCNGNSYKINGRISSFTRHFPNKVQVVLEDILLVPVSGKGDSPISSPDVSRIADQICADAGQTAIPVQGKILCNIYQVENFAGTFGTRMELRGRLKSIRNFSNPNGFDYQRFLLRKNIWGSVYTRKGKFLLVPDSDVPCSGLSWRQSFAPLVERLRNRFFFYIQKRLGSSDSAAVISALVTGKKGMIPHHLRDDFSRAGVSHLLAISGLHMSIVAAGCWWIFFGIFSFSKQNLMSGNARKMAGICTLFPLLAYAVFAGFSPSTQRAFLMTLAFMMAIFSDRENMPINTLALAGCVILLLNPASLFSISFQLSFASVLSILLGMEFVKTRHWFFGKGKLAGVILNACLVSLFAGLGTAPLIVRYFNMVSFVQIPANLILIPLMGLICLPLGLIGAVLFMIHPALADMPILLCGKLVDVSICIVHFLADIPLTWTRMVSLSVWEVLLIYGFMAWGFLFFQYEKYRKSLWGLAFFLFVGFLADGIFLYKKYLFPDYFSIVALDVGQGNSALIRTPDGERILVDGGGFPKYGRKDTGFDVGRHIVGPYLWSQKIMSLDAVVISHPDGDHINGLVFILENFKVKRIIKNQDDNDTNAYEKIMDICRKKNIPVVVPGCDEGLTQVFSNMNLRFFECRGKIQGGSLNDRSLVFQLQFGNFTMLFPGDILAKRERHLAESVGELMQSQVLLCPHHGSASSSRGIFLDRTAPESVIISCGYANRYKFPHPKVLERYRKRNIQVFRTDLDGAVTVVADGKKYAISTSLVH